LIQILPLHLHQRPVRHEPPVPSSGHAAEAGRPRGAGRVCSRLPSSASYGTHCCCSSSSSASRERSSRISSRTPRQPWVAARGPGRVVAVGRARQDGGRDGGGRQAPHHGALVVGVAAVAGADAAAVQLRRALGLSPVVEARDRCGARAPPLSRRSAASQPSPVVAQVASTSTPRKFAWLSPPRCRRTARPAKVRAQNSSLASSDTNLGRGGGTGERDGRGRERARRRRRRRLPLDGRHGCEKRIRLRRGLR
jgi:hypothetical protein